MIVAATDKPKAPALRFPEFKGEWKEESIGEITTINPTNGELPDTFKYIDLESVTSGVLSSPKTIKKIEAPSRAQRILKKNDILFQMVRPYQKNNFFFELDGEYVASTGYAQIRTIQYPQFLFIALQNQHFVNKVIRHSTGSNYPAINSSDLKKLKINAPISTNEQKKIADFLTAVDERIQGLLKKKDLLTSYKKGVMQKLFSQQIRFTQNNGTPFPDWEEKKLGGIYHFIGTNSLSRSSLNYDIGDIYNIHYGDIHTKFQVEFQLNEENVPYINFDEDISKIKNEQFCKVKDIVVADASEDYADIGKSIEIINTSYKKIVAGLHTHHARPKDEAKFALGFSGRLMQSWDIRYQIMRLAVGSKVLGISKTNIQEIDIKLPHPGEQKKIADFLSVLDDKITAISSQIGQAKAFKKGLLQQMFI